MLSHAPEDEPNDPIQMVLDRVALSKALTVEPSWIEPNLEKWICRLCAKYQYVIRLRFGLDEYGVHTLEEIGRELDLTRERIRKIVERSLRLMHAYSLQRYRRRDVDSRQVTQAAPVTPAILVPDIPDTIRKKLRSATVQNELSRLTRRVAGKRYIPLYRQCAERFGCTSLPNESRFFFKNGWWIILGPNFWIIFDRKTVPAAMGVDPAVLECELRKIAERGVLGRDEKRNG